MKLSGWYRLWIFLSVIYFFVVIGFAVYFFLDANEPMKERVRKSIELALPHLPPQVEEGIIKDAMADLKKLLSNKNSTRIDYLFLETDYGIRVDSSKEKLTIKLIPERKFGTFPYKTKISTVKKLEFPINANLIMVVTEVEKVYRKFLKLHGTQTVRFYRYRHLTDKKIISKLHDEYQDILDFSAIDAKYKKDRQMNLFLYILFAFAVWIISVGLVFILGLSIGWIIRGFRKKSTTNSYD